MKHLKKALGPLWTSSHDKRSEIVRWRHRDGRRFDACALHAIPKEVAEVMAVGLRGNTPLGHLMFEFSRTNGVLGAEVKAAKR